jgi:antitoxin ParD1/3/4
MPKRNVILTDELDHFVASRVESGRYADANEVVRSALRLLEREEREYEERLAVLRAAIEKGDASGDAKKDVFDRLYAYIDELADKKAENVA